MVFKLNKPTFHPKLTKLTISVIVLSVVTVALLALVGATYSHYTEQVDATNKQHQAELTAAREAGYKAGTSDRNAYLAKYNLAMLECRKGQNAYNLLSTTQKNTLTKAGQVVNCNQPVLAP